jgi:2-phospho-L-lactate/phosphoenolpyruvate guanylyltransferase
MLKSRLVDAARTTWAVVVARTGLSAKTRLAEALSRPEDRARLARAMLADVLAACAATGLGGTLVVTDTGAGWSTAWTWGARPHLDPSRGLNAAVASGLAAAMRAGARTALVLPGDVPLARASDLREVLGAAGERPKALVVVPDHAGDGTNALVVRPPEFVEPAFGPGSAAAHLESAGAAGIRFECPGLALDIDTPAELASLLQLDTGGAAATRRFLRSLRLR